MNKLILLNLLAASLLAGCASNRPFNDEQLAIVKQKKIVVKPVSADEDNSLRIYSKSGKAGTEVAKAAVGLLLFGSFGSNSTGNTPRTRFHSGVAYTDLFEAGRKASGEKVMIKTPTQTIQEMLANSFEVLPSGSEINPNDLTITAKTVAWHLYYDKILSEETTYYLEYAGDINMSLPTEKLQRHFSCDKQSEQTLTKEDWLANDELRIRTFVNDVANRCVQQVLRELGETTEQAE